MNIFCIKSCQHTGKFSTHITFIKGRKNQLPSREANNEYLPCYDVGIFLVGYSSLPIVLSLAEINPTEKIYFIYSKDTKDVLDEIHNRIQGYAVPYYFFISSTCWEHGSE